MASGLYNQMDLSKIDMKTMIFWRNILVMTAAILSLASCSSDPQWADEEAYEKTEWKGLSQVRGN
jgi:hypothetical protein